MELKLKGTRRALTTRLVAFGATFFNKKVVSATLEERAREILKP